MLKKFAISTLTAAVLACSMSVYAEITSPPPIKQTNTENVVIENAPDKRIVNLTLIQVRLKLNDQNKSSDMFGIIDKIQGDLDLNSSKKSVYDILNNYGSFARYRVSTMNTTIGAITSSTTSDIISYVDSVDTDQSNKLLKSNNKILELKNSLILSPSLTGDNNLIVNYSLREDNLISIKKVEKIKDVWIEAPDVSIKESRASVKLYKDDVRIVSSSNLNTRMDNPIFDKNKKESDTIDLILMKANY